LQEAGLLVVILLLAAFLTFAGGEVNAGGRLVNNFLRLDNIIPSVATPMSWIAVMALGATIVIAAGGIDISVGSMSGVAALAAAAALQGVSQRWGVDANPWIVLPVGILVPLAVGLACGLINGAIVVGLRMHPFIVTLGTLSIFRGIALVAVPSKSLPTGDYSLPTAFTRHFIAWPMEIPQAGLPPLLLQPVPMLIMLACLLVAWVFLRHTVPGRQVYAIGGNEEAARFSGIPVQRVKLTVYALSGLSCGVAGMLSCGYFGSASTNTNLGYELTVIAAAVVGGASLSGGRGTALGALLGALVIKLIENGTFILKKIDLGVVTVPVSREYDKIVVGAAIILAVAIDRLSEYVQSRRAVRGGGVRGAAKRAESS
jgi:ribose/xylose/arabinose/galactoside ABC-type transport system permease subunit